MTDENIERGAAEDATDTPVTPTDIEASRRPPSQSPDEAGTDEPGDTTGSQGSNV